MAILLFPTFPFSPTNEQLSSRGDAETRREKVYFSASPRLRVSSFEDVGNSKITITGLHHLFNTAHYHAGFQLFFIILWNGNAGLTSNIGTRVL